MTWVLVLLMLGSQYQWPDVYPSASACAAAGRALVIDGQAEVKIIDGYRCDPLPTARLKMEDRG